MNEITNLLVSIHKGNTRMTDKQFADQYRGQAKKIRKGVHDFQQILEAE